MKNLIIKIVVNCFLFSGLFIFIVYQLTTPIEYNVEYFYHLNLGSGFYRDDGIIIYKDGTYKYRSQTEFSGDIYYAFGSYTLDKNEKSTVLVDDDGLYFAEIVIKSKDRIDFNVPLQSAYSSRIFYSSIHYKYYKYYDFIYTILSLVVIVLAFLLIRNLRRLQMMISHKNSHYSTK
jgi:hypothetical protein